MKKSLQNLFAGILLLSSAFAAAQDWQWLQPSVSATNTSVLGTDVDELGNTYTLGAYSNSIKYDTMTLTGPGTAYYLAKHNSNGKILGMKNIHSMFTKLRADHSGNVYISGEFNTSNSAFIGTDTLRDTDPSHYLLLTKLNNSLKPVWSIYYNNILNSQVPTYDVFVDASDNVYLLVHGNQGLIIGGITYAPAYTIGILKISSSGTILYYKQLPNTTFGMLGAADANGNAYVTGMAYGSVKTLTVDAASATNTNPAFNSNSVIDQFMIKFNATGVAQWINMSNNALSNTGAITFGPNGISLDSKANIFVYGDYNNKIVFGTDTLKGMITDQNSTNPYIVKYTSGGAKKWAYTTTQTLGPGLQFLQMKISKKDLLYFYCTKINGGAYVNTFHFPKLSGSGSSDRYLACFDTTMTNKWYRYIQGGEQNDQKANIGVSNAEDVYVASGAKTSIKLGYLDTLTTPGLGVFKQYKNFIATSSPGVVFAYIAKYAADTLATQIKTIVNEQGIKLYPNPASNIVFLENQSGKQVQIELYSISGILVRRINSETTTTEISVGDLSKGLYFIKVFSSDFSATKKFVVD